MARWGDWLYLPSALHHAADADHPYMVVWRSGPDATVARFRHGGAGGADPGSGNRQVERMTGRVGHRMTTRVRRAG